MLLAAARDVEHDGGVLLDLSGGDGVDERCRGDAGCRIDVDALEVVEELAGLAGHGVRGYEELAAGGFQRVVEPAGDGVGRTAVRQHLGVDDLRIAARLVGVVRQHLARIGPPGVVHRNERRVLRHHELHGVRTETAVLDKAHVGLPGGDGPRTAAHGLEIVVGNAADGRYGRKDRAGHAVAARDVLGPALGVEARTFQRQVAQVNGVEIVAALVARNEFHAGIQRLVEPQRVDVVERHRQQQADVVVGADLGEGAGRISGRGDHQHATLVFGCASADRVGFGLLERTRGHRGPDSRIIAVESDPEVFQPEVPGQPLALVGHGSRRALEDAPHGQPVAEAVEPPLGGLHVELFAGVFGADERRFLVLRVGEHPAGVLEFAPRGDALQGVGSRCKIFHLSLFVLFTTCGF